MPSSPGNPSWFVLILLVQLGALLGFLWWSRRLTAPGVRPFRLTILGMATRTATEAIEILYIGRAPLVLLWSISIKCMATCLGIAGIVLLFADVSGLNGWATPVRRRLLVAVMLAVGALAFTNPQTGFVGPNALLATGWSYRHFQHGPGGNLLWWCGSAALLFGIGATLRAWRGASPLQRQQLKLLLAGCGLPGISLLAYRSSFYPENWPSLTPAARLSAIGCFAWALSREQLWRLVPIARSFVLEHHDHGMIVADHNRAVVDSNPAARRLLRLPADTTPYGPLAALLAAWPELQQLARSSGDASCECRPDPATDTCWLASWHPLRAQPAEAPKGYLLAIADITARKRIELALQQALAARTHEWQRATAAALRAAEEEQCRLGHLLHDTLCQDLVGCARQVALVRDDLTRGTVPDPTRLAALEAALAEAGKRAREISHVLAGTIHSGLSFGEQLAAVLRQLEDSLGLECELAIDSAFPLPNPDQCIQLVRIVREAVVNAARHGHATRVWVDLIAGTDHTSLTVGNDGKPPPPLPREGLGLQQMRMRAALLGGQIRLRAEPGGGACLELTLPSPLPQLSAT